MEPFFTTKEVGKGSGLGLSMVYGFAKQSNGAFHIDSELGRGTSAHIWLPKSPESQPTADRRSSLSLKKPHLKTPKLSLLLVDDHPEVRSTTAAVLSDFGHSVREAASGTEALKMLEGGGCRCDLLISDYAMPNLSGTDFLRQARTLCPDVPALFVPGYADLDEIGNPPENVEILLKPFTPAALEAAIARACGQSAVAE